MGENVGSGSGVLFVSRLAIAAFLASAALGACDSATDPDPGPPKDDGTQVDSEGGTVNYAPSGATDVAVNLTFPAGAVPDGTMITVEEGEAYPSDPDIEMIPELVFEFGPEGIVFGTPVAMTITYDPSVLGGIAPEDLRIFRTVGDTWEALETTLDEPAQTLSAMMPGFSFGGAGVPEGTSENAPINTTGAEFINDGAETTTSRQLSLDISATDDLGVTGYFIQLDSGEPPEATAAGWFSVLPTTDFAETVGFLLPYDTEGLKTLYVFFKDADGLVSEGVSDTILYEAGGPLEGVLIDFEFYLVYRESAIDTVLWGGGGPCCRQYENQGVVFDFTNTSHGTGSGCPYVVGAGEHHKLNNDKNYSGRLTGIIHMMFSVDPQEVRFILSFPSAVGSIDVEVDDATGGQLPGSAIQRSNERIMGSLTLQDITINWPAGIGEVRLRATRSDVFVDDLFFGSP
jgi:hypothetical protein